MLTGKVVDRFQVKNLGKVTIRYPEMNDAKEILEYMNSVIEEQVFTTNKEKDMNWEINKLSDVLKEIEKKKRVALVTELNNKVMGLGDITKKPEARSHSGELGIGLKKKIREKGIGSKLIEALIQESRKNLEIEMVILKTYRSNRPAINLYEKFDFRKIGEIEKGAKYRDKYKDIVIMKKDL